MMSSDAKAALLALLFLALGLVLPELIWGPDPAIFGPAVRVQVLRP